MRTEDVLQPIARIPDMEADIPSLKTVPSLPGPPITKRTADSLRCSDNLVNDLVQRSDRQLVGDAGPSVDVGRNFTIFLLLVERKYVAGRGPLVR